MSEHRSHHVAAAIAVLAFAAPAAPEASAVPVDPDRGSQSSPLVPYDWPDEGSGYPGYGDQPAPTGSTKGSALDATSVALGALGGIAFGAAGLGITLAVQRRRDHTSLSEV